MAEAAKDLTGVVVKLGEVFFLPDALGGLEADGMEFGGVNEGVIKGGVVEASPSGAVTGVGEAFPEPVFAVGGAEEEGVAFAFEEHGLDDLGPDGGLHEGGFVEDDEIEAGTAQVIGGVGAFDGDPAAAGEVEAAVGFADGDL